MGKLSQKLSRTHREFVAKQHLFFVATVGNNTKINLSPKGVGTLKILDDNHLVWLNLTGSGSETSAHLLENKRMTIMFCSFDEKPLIVRLYGYVETLIPADNPDLLALFPTYTGVRQIFKMTITDVLDSCGFGVPTYQFTGERQLLIDWSDKKGENGILDYQQKNNLLSLDNKPTGLKFQEK